MVGRFAMAVSPLAKLVYIVLMENDRNHLCDIEPIMAWRYF
jgi:hypothetical protein